MTLYHMLVTWFVSNLWHAKKLSHCFMLVMVCFNVGCDAKSYVKDAAAEAAREEIRKAEETAKKAAAETAEAAREEMRKAEEAAKAAQAAAAQQLHDLQVRVEQEAAALRTLESERSSRMTTWAWFLYVLYILGVLALFKLFGRPVIRVLCGLALRYVSPEPRQVI